MARLLVLASILGGGCAFTGHDAGDGASGPDASVVDVVRSCKAPPADVRLCIDFEDASLALRALDGSGRLNDASATAILPLRRVAFAVPEQAAQLSGLSSLHVAETPALDLAMFTIEMWIRPDMVPAPSLVYGLLDNYGQYSMQLASDGRLRCALDDASSVDSHDPLALGMWHHVACRYDGDEMRAYVDGDVSDCNQIGPVTSDPTAGTAIGARITPPTSPAIAFRDNFLGGIDNVRIYNGAIDEARLCAASGGASCKHSCPSGDEHGGGGHGH
jgi:hypothetical protein